MIHRRVRVICWSAQRTLTTASAPLRTRLRRVRSILPGDANPERWRGAVDVNPMVSSFCDQDHDRSRSLHTPAPASIERLKYSSDQLSRLSARRLGLGGADFNLHFLGRALLGHRYLEL